LVSPAAAVRLAGVYALARIADDSVRDRPTCLKVLCAYLRMPYDPDADPPAERQVRTTAQMTIAERLRPGHSGFWTDADVDLTGAYLIGLDMSTTTMGYFKAFGATFSGNAWFGEATFSRYAQFTKTTFYGDAWFGEAVFNGYTQFTAATFYKGAQFAKTTFPEPISFDKATFSRSCPPEWPDGFTEPIGILWAPIGAKGPDPGSPDPDLEI